MNTYELAQQQIQVNNELMKCLSDLQDMICAAHRSKNNAEHLDHLHTMWKRIGLALITRDEIVGDKDDSERDVTTDLHQIAADLLGFGIHRDEDKQRRA